MQGVAEHFTHTGRRIGCIVVAQSPIVTALCVGPLVWFGVGDGRVIAHDIETHDRVASFSAHASSVIAITQSGMFLYSLGADGSVYGWNAVVRPAGGPGGVSSAAAWHAEWLRAAEKWNQKLPESVKAVRVGMRVCSWNVSDLRPRPQSVQALISGGPRGCAVIKPY